MKCNRHNKRKARDDESGARMGSIKRVNERVIYVNEASCRDELLALDESLQMDQQVRHLKWEVH